MTQILNFDLNLVMFLMSQPLLSPASAGLEALLKASSDDSCFGGGGL